MAFPTGWNSKHKLTIDHTKVSGSANLTNFPVYLSGDNFLESVWNVSNNDGGDLRFSSDEAGANQLACEVVWWDKGSKTGEVYVKIPTLKHNEDTDIYVWYGKPGETQPAVTDTYGRNAVWNDLKYVSHMHGSSTDSTGARTTTDSNISYGTSYGKYGQGALFTRASPSKIYPSSLGISGTTAITISGWVYFTDSDFQRLYSQGVWSSNTAFIFYRHQNTYLSATCGAARDVGAQDIALSQNTWYYVTCVYPGSGSMMNIKFYVNGVGQTTSSWGAGSGNNPNMADSNYRIGESLTGSDYGYVNGRIDELRVGNVARSADWIATEYANQNSPSTFVTGSEARTPNHGFINHQNPGIV